MKSIDKRLSEPDDLCRGPEPERAKRLRERGPKDHRQK